MRKRKRKRERKRERERDAVKNGFPGRLLSFAALEARREEEKNSFPYKKKKVFVPRTKTGKNTFLFVSSLDNEQDRKSGKKAFSCQCWNFKGTFFL